MADQDQAVDTDYSGRPYRQPSTTEELLLWSAQRRARGPSPYDRFVKLPDGRTVVCGGQGKYYLRKPDGWPDRDQPVHISGLSAGPPKPGDLIIQPDQPK